jgi:hypothetical protein
MRARVFLGGLVALSVLVIAASARSHVARKPPARYVPPETPWLTPAAAAQIVGPEGRLGPLFDHVMLGGPVPSAERARIAEFARANHVAIDLEVVGDELAAIRFEVKYGGCCGYEGADRLARRLDRPRIGSGCTGDGPTWLDDWVIANDDGSYARASVRVNRVLVRWEHQLTTDELLERVDGLLGADRVAIAKAERDRWTEVEPSRSYRLELPYAFDGSLAWYPDVLGLQVAAARGHITAVAFEARDQDDASTTMLRARMMSRWGRPAVRDDQWTWRLRDRVVTAALDGSTTKVSVALR